MSTFLSISNIVWFVLGIIFGFLGGIAIYFSPLRQFKNEFKSVYNLVKYRYHFRSQITLRSGTVLIDSVNNQTILSNKKIVTVNRDCGVEWFFTPTKGWIRTRVLEVYDDSNPQGTFVKVSAFDVLKF